MSLVGPTHGAPYRGYGYAPLRFGRNVVRRMGTQQQLVSFCLLIPQCQHLQSANKIIVRLHSGPLNGWLHFHTFTCTGNTAMCWEPDPRQQSHVCKGKNLNTRLLPYLSQIDKFGAVEMSDNTLYFYAP